MPPSSGLVDRQVGLLRRAIAARSGFPSEETSAYRLIDGEADQFEGLIAEVYGDAILINTETDHQPASDFLKALELEFPNFDLWWKPRRHEGKTPATCLVGKGQPDRVILENQSRYAIDFAAGYSHGLFLDQRENRQRVADACAKGRLLNLFSYTCGFSVAAAAKGAETTSIDLAPGVLNWGRRNFELNDLDPAAHRFLGGDVFEWLKRLAKREERFEGIVLDPPTFSRNRNGKIFRVETGYTALVEQSVRLLAPGGFLLASTNCQKLTPQSFVQMVREGLPSGTARWKIEKLPMPIDFPGSTYLKVLWVAADFKGHGGANSGRPT